MVPKNFIESKDRLDIKSKDLSDILNVKKSTISGYINGFDTIPLKKLIEYANYSKFTLDYLFGLSKFKLLENKIKIDNKIVGLNLKQLRCKNNLTQQQIANKLHINQSTYSNYETGKNLISTNDIFALSNIYKSFSIDNLFIKK